MAISPLSLLHFHTLPCTLERKREGEEEEEEGEGEELTWRLWSIIPFLSSQYWWLRACGWSFEEDQTSTLLGLELGLEHPRGSLPTSRHSGDGHRDTYSPCGIGRRSGLPLERLIPRVGMLTTTGPLGSAPARQPTSGSQGQTAFGRVSSYLTLSIQHAMWTLTRIDSSSLLELERDFLLLRVLRDLWTTPFGETKGSETVWWV
uniref:Uncharacterized protein n=1 Tax=Ananas comosus var. bracteatus TaxID=296719 RepID=A0A6V7PUV2_ANACO|nr:unnamed protein product [Ananas comosus var. bracteatus]